MKKNILMALTVTLLLATIIAPVFAGTGNNLPSGKHYTLNILGKNWNKGDAALIPPEDPVEDPNPVVKDNDNGHRIFVKLGSDSMQLKTRISLVEGDDFGVIDCDGTDGKASFMLPDPGDVIVGEAGYDPNEAAYLVFIKVLSPHGSAEMGTGVWTDPVDGVWLRSEEVIYLNKVGSTKSNSKGDQFLDVTKELTTILADFDNDPETPSTRIKIFDERYQYYFWDFDNNGLKHVQLRFYPIEN